MIRRRPNAAKQDLPLLVTHSLGLTPECKTFVILYRLRDHPSFQRLASSERHCSVRHAYRVRVFARA